jgi:hypothetical protein
MSLQITAYLPARDATAFQAYAASFGLDKSGLANLLIRREIANRRLPELLAFHHHVPRAACIKITAHLPNDEVKSAFAAAAEAAKLKPGAAAAMLFRAELEERTLEQYTGNV